MSDEQAPSSRGNYLTQQRYLELERKIAAQEARMNERMEQLERRLGDVAGQVYDGARAQAKALIDLLQERAAR